MTEDSGGPGVPDESATDRTDSEAERTAGASEALSNLAACDGWHVEGVAARVHYRGASDRYSIEYYAPSECVLYWKVPPEDTADTAVPVGRSTVPSPLRDRIRDDLRASGIDPSVERRDL